MRENETRTHAHTRASERAREEAAAIIETLDGYILNAKKIRRDIERIARRYARKQMTAKLPPRSHATATA